MFMEAQQEENGPHFDVGGAGALGEPQPASRQVVNQDLPQELPTDFSYLNLVPDDSPDTDYVPSISRQQSSDQGLRRSTRSKKPSQAYIDSLASRSFFDSNVLQLLANAPDILVSLLPTATSKPRERQYAPSKLTARGIGFEPNG
ncbi:hypothetical protein ACN42_g6816 [Penicillium freii]|uniref:Uncharacterized protein n=1 Tax=Penicillium freii TaxID=48697 RepID=A0A101MH32_PENFR|nr:hypothetical protein ACN42_g6816 [Penicillium freii]